MQEIDGQPLEIAYNPHMSEENTVESTPESPDPQLHAQAKETPPAASEVQTPSEPQEPEKPKKRANRRASKRPKIDIFKTKTKKRGSKKKRCRSVVSANEVIERVARSEAKEIGPQSDEGLDPNGPWDYRGQNLRKTLRQAFKASGLSYTRLVFLAGVQAQACRNALSGDRDASYETLARLMKALGVYIRYRDRIVSYDALKVIGVAMQHHGEPEPVIYERLDIEETVGRHNLNGTKRPILRTVQRLMVSLHCEAVFNENDHADARRKSKQP